MSSIALFITGVYDQVISYAFPESSLPTVNKLFSLSWWDWRMWIILILVIVIAGILQDAYRKAKPLQIPKLNAFFDDSDPSCVHDEWNIDGSQYTMIYRIGLTNLEPITVGNTKVLLTKCMQEEENVPSKQYPVRCAILKPDTDVKPDDTFEIAPKGIVYINILSWDSTWGEELHIQYLHPVDKFSSTSIALSSSYSKCHCHYKLGIAVMHNDIIQAKYALHVADNPITMQLTKEN
jgi:hypothetical protein